MPRHANLRAEASERGWEELRLGASWAAEAGAPASSPKPDRSRSSPTRPRYIRGCSTSCRRQRGITSNAGRTTGSTPITAG